MVRKKKNNNDAEDTGRRSNRSKAVVNYKEDKSDTETNNEKFDSESDFESKVIVKGKGRRERSSSSDDDIPLTNVKNKKKVTCRSKTKKDNKNNSNSTISPFKGLFKGRSNGLDSDDDAVVTNSSDSVVGIRPSFANICRPNLSEGESSDSDEEISPQTCNQREVKSSKDACTTGLYQKSDENLSGGEICNDNLFMEEDSAKKTPSAEKRKILFSQCENEIPEKCVKLEDPISSVGIKMEDEDDVESVAEKTSSQSLNQSLQKKAAENGKDDTMETKDVDTDEESIAVVKTVTKKTRLSSKLAMKMKSVEDSNKPTCSKNIKTESDDDLVIIEPTVQKKSLSSKLAKRKSIADIPINDIKTEDTEEAVECLSENIPSSSKSLRRRKDIKETIETPTSSERKKAEVKLKKKKGKRKKVDSITLITSDDGSESDDNWEDVDEKKIKTPKKSKKKKKTEKEEEEEGVGDRIANPEINIKDLEISVDVESIHAKKKKKSREEKLFVWMRQLAHRILKETQLLLHKCHLLCLLANALKENECCHDDDLLRAVCMSLIPKEYSKPSPYKWDINHVRRFTTWFQRDVPATQELILLIDEKAKHLEKLKRIHIFVIMLRSIGFPCRIIYSLLPCSSKVKKGDDDSLRDLDSKAMSMDTETPAKKKGKKGKRPKKKKKGSATSPGLSAEEDPDPDFTVTTGQKVPGSTRPKPKSSKKDITAVSSQDVATGCNHWAEVYLETLRRWICVELATLTINSPNKCEAAATKPLQYVIALDNDKKVKDVTCRYAEKWLTVNRKMRADRDWWAETIEPYKPFDDSRNTAEDAQLRANLMQKDLPKTIGELKDHPLYAIQRHLLKFQAIYPPDIVPVGFINKEPIFPRDSVYELHTRETWMKQARVVKPGEVPYKMVKARPKWSERHLKKEVMSPIFGVWQTEDYVPPPVVDGKVPKNEYGNVELFKPSMLPEGAVHLPMANMKNIARSMGIDFAPAMMGWDFHGGFSHPVFEGVVVAKEYEDKLLDAWNKQEEERERKEQLKREKEIYDNWKKLIKGLLIRARLKSKYAFEEEETEIVQPNKGKKGNPNIKPVSKVKNDATKKVVPTEEDNEYTSTSGHWPQMITDG